MRDSERRKINRYLDTRYGLKWLCENFKVYGDLVLDKRQQDVFRRYFMTDEPASSIARSYQRNSTTIFRVIWQSKRKLIRWNSELNRACKKTKWYDITLDGGAPKEPE